MNVISTAILSFVYIVILKLTDRDLPDVPLSTATAFRE